MREQGREGEGGGREGFACSVHQTNMKLARGPYSEDSGLAGGLFSTSMSA